MNMGFIGKFSILMATVLLIGAQLQPITYASSSSVSVGTNGNEHHRQHSESANNDEVNNSNGQQQGTKTNGFGGRRSGRANEEGLSGSVQNTVSDALKNNQLVMLLTNPELLNRLINDVLKNTGAVAANLIQSTNQTIQQIPVIG